MDCYVERAHIRARHSRDEDNRVFNLLDLCPTCHKYFDNKLITMHPIWRCWVFSDIVYKTTTYGSRFTNFFRGFQYSYPPEAVVSKVDSVLEESIIWNNENEFEVRGDHAAHLFFQCLEKKLRCNEKWDHENERPRTQIIKSEYNLLIPE